MRETREKIILLGGWNVEVGEQGFKGQRGKEKYDRILFGKRIIN